MIKKKEIKFPNGNRAQLERPAASSPADDILKKLGIKQPEALIMIVGGAAGLDDSLKPCILQLFSISIACAAIKTGAIIMDGGTKADLIELIGLS